MNGQVQGIQQQTNHRSACPGSSLRRCRGRGSPQHPDLSEFCRPPFQGPCPGSVLWDVWFDFKTCHHILHISRFLFLIPNVQTNVMPFSLKPTTGIFQPTEKSKEYYNEELPTVNILPPLHACTLMLTLAHSLTRTHACSLAHSHTRLHTRSRSRFLCASYVIYPHVDNSFAELFENRLQIFSIHLRIRTSCI